MNNMNYMNRKMNRKGQLTIFIIIGIVLLFSTALIIYIKQSVVEYKPPVEVAVEQVPTELRPLQTFITECAKSTVLEAVKKAGTQGGYIDTSKISVNDNDPTSGQGISLSPGSDVKIPYWYYMQSPNDCSQDCALATEQPSLYRSAGIGNSLEEQFDKYVEQRISICLSNFEQFKQQGLEIEAGKMKAFTTIAKTDVFVQLDFPITVKLQNRVETMSKFTARIPVNLGKFYDLAAELTKKEISSGFLSSMALNLIESYSSIDKNKLPPLADSVFDRSSPVVWMKKDVKNKLEELLMIYTPAMQAMGTLNFKGNLYKGNSPLAEGLYNLFILPMNKTYNANVEFSYLSWWPIYLKVTPSEGEMIKPESASGFSLLPALFGITQYKFAYDVSFPVLIQLSDSEALNGEGFIFQFAIESNLRNNDVIQSNATIISYSSRSKQTMVCDDKNFNSEEVTIDVSDSMTKAALEDAIVYLSFGKESCLVGTTTLVNGKGIIKSKMPVGVGSLIISKEDYLSKTVPFSASLTEKKEVSAELDRFVELNISVARLPVVANTVGGAVFWLPQQQTLPDLEATQKAVITLSRIPENNAQEEHVAVVEINGNDTQSKMARIVPGNYKIIGNLFDYQTTIIPESEECYPDDWYDNFGLGKKKCITIDEISFDVFPKGGVSIDSFVIEPETLKNSKELVITLVTAPDGYTRTEDGITNLKARDLDKMGLIEQYSRDYYELIEPVFK